MITSYRSVTGSRPAPLHSRLGQPGAAPGGVGGGLAGADLGAGGLGHLPAQQLVAARVLDVQPKPGPGSGCWPLGVLRQPVLAAVACYPTRVIEVYRAWA
jgi:hypothetical protein